MHINYSILILGFLTAFFVVLFTTPSLIKVAKLKHLVDEPGEDRKLHKKRIPTIGGIAIFSSILFSYALWFPDDSVSNHNLAASLQEFKYIVACLLILFFVGVKDDIIGTAPVKKLVAHIIVAFILLIMAGIEITSMHGLFGIKQSFPDSGSAFLTIFVYIVIVNSINLIDGLDGLAAGIGCIAGGFFGTWFILAGYLPLALLSLILSGALLGFLVFNFSPAKIFMGDSGSLTIGAIVSILAIRLIEMPTVSAPEFIHNVNTPVMAMCILVYPLVDTLRVFTIRAIKGRSPFSADKNHIHHRILALGYTHAQTVLMLFAYSILIVCAFVGLSQLIDSGIAFLCILALAFGIVAIPLYASKSIKEE